MMSTATIADLQRQAAREARRERREPVIFYNDEDVSESVTTMPFLGDYVPQGWRSALWTDLPGEDPHGHGHYGAGQVLLFADATGWGDEDEPALSLRQLVTTVNRMNHEAYANGRLTLGWAIWEAGEFQVHIKAYVKVA